MGEVAEYSFTGTLTSPKLIAPDQIARAIDRLYTRPRAFSLAAGDVLPLSGGRPASTSHNMARRGVSSAVTLPPFQRLLDSHGPDLHRFLTALVGRGDADDCYQETCLAALRAYPGLRDASNLRSWLLTVGHHKAIDLIRARGRLAIPTENLPEPAHNPASEPRDDGLWESVRALPAKQRTALALRYVVDAPYTEISAVMETTEDAARRNVHEAIKRLRLEYQR